MAQEDINDLAAEKGVSARKSLIGAVGSSSMPEMPKGLNGPVGPSVPNTGGISKSCWGKPPAQDENRSPYINVGCGAPDDVFDDARFMAAAFESALVNPCSEQLLKRALRAALSQRDAALSALSTFTANSAAPSPAKSDPPAASRRHAVAAAEALESAGRQW